MKWEALQTLFSCGGIDIDRLSRSQPGTQDTSPDYDQILSHRILPADTSGRANLYSFVKDQWKEDAQLPPRSELHSNASANKSSKYSPESFRKIRPQYPEITLPIHAVSHSPQRENSLPNSRELQSQQRLQTPPQEPEIPVQRTVESFSIPATVNQPSQHYRQTTDDPLTRQPISQLNQGSSEGLAPNKAPLPQQQLPLPEFQYSSGSTRASFLASPLPNGQELGYGFPVPVEYTAEGSNLWWDQSFDGMLMDT